MKNKILNVVDDYYSKKIIEFGDTPNGVDWKDQDSQYLRFEKLCDVIDFSNETISILDFGCGTGAFLTYLNDKGFKNVDYYGYDVSSEMLDVAKKKFEQGRHTFSNDIPTDEKFSYVIASGILNVKLGISDDEWKDYILSLLDRFSSLSEKGFSFNALTLYSDVDKRRGDLFYSDPLYLFDICKKNYSRFVSLDHSYPLYEFTISVKKN